MPRLEVAVIDRDGNAQVVNIARPSTLVAFADNHEGRDHPASAPELHWMAHHALGVDAALEQWLDGLETVSMMPADVALARAIIDGDDHARRVALGLDPPDHDFVTEAIEKYLEREGAPVDGRDPLGTPGAPRSPA
jgi:hypothetical protein